MVSSLLQVSVLTSVRLSAIRYTLKLCSAICTSQLKQWQQKIKTRLTTKSASCSLVPFIVQLATHQTVVSDAWLFSGFNRCDQYKTLIMLSCTKDTKLSTVSEISIQSPHVVLIQQLRLYSRYIRSDKFKMPPPYCS